VQNHCTASYDCIIDTLQYRPKKGEIRVLRVCL
jgi:hypothetical protein